MDELSQEQIAALRGWIRQAMADGHPLSQIDATLTAKYPKIKGSTEVMKMSGNDFARSMGQGLTLGHLDELAGLVAKVRGTIKGKSLTDLVTGPTADTDYTLARDQVRKNDQEAKAANPKMSAAVEMLSGAIPGVLSSAIPGLDMQAGAHLANAAKAAVGGAAMGAVAGEGFSNAGSARDVTKDAVFSAIPSMVIGGAGGAVASRLATKGLPTGAKGAVMKEGAGLLPNLDPNDIRQIAARQERLAPGTLVAADLSPQMQRLASGVGADLKTGMAARNEAAQRFQALQKALGDLGSHYDILLKGEKAPADPEIIAAVAGTGRKGVLKGNSVDLTAIQELRSDILKRARMTNDRAQAYDLRQQAQPLTDWLQKQVPDLKGLDSDYAFLSQRTAVAKKTLDIINRSAANYGTNRAYGMNPGSVGASIPLPGGGPGTVIKTVAKALTNTDRATRAKTVYQQFLTPTRGSNTLENILKVHDILGQPIDISLSNAARSALFNGVVPIATSPSS